MTANPACQTVSVPTFVLYLYPKAASHYVQHVSNASAVEETLAWLVRREANKDYF
jgi:hypothetical protein